ncbi:MAG: hypothetical protein ACLQNE_19250 [Thermoguttaceae bacterium]
MRMLMGMRVRVLVRVNYIPMRVLVRVNVSMNMGVQVIVLD